MKKTTWVFTAIISVTLGTLILRQGGEKKESRAAVALNEPTSISSPARVPAFAPPVALSSEPARTLASAKQIQTQWTEFKHRYGENLQASFLPNGRLVAIHGDPTQGTRAPGDFKSDNAQKVMARAQEILNASRDLLGIKADQPLAFPLYRGNEYSAQVAYRESIGGLPVAPYGNVTVALGADGQLTSLSSDYIPNIEVSNLHDARQAPESNRDRAIASISDPTEAIRSGGGGAIIWVGSRTPGDSSTESVPARVARSYFVQGHEVIVDATNGAVILKKDKRVF